MGYHINGRFFLSTCTRLNRAVFLARYKQCVKSAWYSVNFELV